MERVQEDARLEVVIRAAHKGTKETCGPDPAPAPYFALAGDEAGGVRGGRYGRWENRMILGRCCRTAPYHKKNVFFIDS